MKKTLVFIVLVALLINCVSIPRYYDDHTRSEQIMISERVGETIEPDEREQFDLFHGIDEFKAAIFYSISGGGYEVEILTTNKKLVAVNRDPKGIEILRNYIDSYAKMQYSKKNFEKEWKIVDYDCLGQPITEYEVYGNKKYSCFIGGAFGCGVLSFIPVWIMAYMANWQGSNPPDNPDMTVFISGMVLAIGTGALMGNTIGKNIALKKLKTIKKARKPRIVE